MTTYDCFFLEIELYNRAYFIHRLNTRRIIRGRGTDHEEHTTNNTNMFRLGTRMPSMGSELERWDKVSRFIFECPCPRL